MKNTLKLIIIALPMAITMFETNAMDNEEIFTLYQRLEKNSSAQTSLDKPQWEQNLDRYCTRCELSAAKQVGQIIKTILQGHVSQEREGIPGQQESTETHETVTRLWSELMDLLEFPTLEQIKDEDRVLLKVAYWLSHHSSQHDYRAGHRFRDVYTSCIEFPGSRLCDEKFPDMIKRSSAFDLMKQVLGEDYETKTEQMSLYFEGYSDTSGDSDVDKFISTILIPEKTKTARCLPCCTIL